MSIPCNANNNTTTTYKFTMIVINLTINLSILFFLFLYISQYSCSHYTSCPLPHFRFNRFRTFLCSYFDAYLSLYLLSHNSIFSRALRESNPLARFCRALVKPFTQVPKCATGYHNRQHNLIQTNY